VPNDKYCRTIERLKAPAQYEALLNAVLRTGKPVLITRNGEPYVEMRPQGPRAAYARRQQGMQAKR